MSVAGAGAAPTLRHSARFIVLFSVKEMGQVECETMSLREEDK